LPADRPLASNQAGRVENRQQWQDHRQQRHDQVWDQVENHPRFDFWNDQPNWAAWRITRPYGWATWAALTPWVGYGVAEPVYYNYGDNVYYQDGGVYFGEQQVATADQYTQQAETIASTGAGVDPAQSDWMPLGVFAVTQDGQASGGTPSLYMQLAVNKEGILSGTIYHELTGETEPLEGAVDKQSQRAAWTAKGKPRPLIETGLGNLTKDSAPALIHFADGQTQQWLLVRLPEPQE
jgi:hypothetical protein